MKIAVIHEWLNDWAGSERVLGEILNCYPSADVFALVDFLSPEDRQKILGKTATTSFIQRMPFARSHLRAYVPFMPIAVEQFDLSGYELIISSSHAVAKGVIVGPDQLHVSYVHSPMRYAWDLQHQYLRGPAGRGLKGLVMRTLLHYLRNWDSRSANSVEAFAANSQFIARRIWKVYRRPATVIYPPVAVERFTPTAAKDDFYLCASRLEPYKRTDLVVAAFRSMPDRKLIVIGAGPELKALRKKAAPNIEMLGYQSQQVLADHLQRAKALVFAAEEDFGILPVEAQACGTPVIALGKGGACETVHGIGDANPTGIFFAEQTAAAIVAAVEEFERSRDLFTVANCTANAERFRPERFRNEFKAFVDEQIALHSSANTRALKATRPTPA